MWLGPAVLCGPGAATAAAAANAETAKTCSTKVCEPRDRAAVTSVSLHLATATATGGIMATTRIVVVVTLACPSDTSGLRFINRERESKASPRHLESAATADANKRCGWP